MSHQSKVEYLKEAKRVGSRTYLYYVATSDVEINVDRVAARAACGGHDVPEEKIRSRYKRSLALLPAAIQQSDRCYIFDSSLGGSFHDCCIAEITDGCEITLLRDEIPAWFAEFIAG